MRQAFKILLIGAVFFGSCREKPQEEVRPQAEAFLPPVPANLAASVPYPERNPFTREGVLLGRKLFYDPILSGSNTISCATCHQPEKAFTDGMALTTLGISGKPLRRHTPTLANIAWAEGWFWDGGAKDIESLNFGPVTHPDEMGQKLSELVTELQQHPEYPALFQAAFNSGQVTSSNISRALSQFQRTLISANSKYDKHIRNEGGVMLTAAELEGLTIFRQKCGSCHSTDFFTDYDYHNNGLDNTYSTDHEEVAYGRGRITQQPADIGKFKTPTLRNVAVTAPFMHDGRFATLEQVLDHYQSGVKASATLDPLLQQNGIDGIPMTAHEKESIILFLNTLTDHQFISDRSLARPD